MGLFGFGKNKDVVDLAERYRKQKEREQNMREDMEGSGSSDTATSASPFSFFDSGSSSSSESSSDDGFVDLSSASTDKRRKLAKRILDMTTKIEDLSNQMYHLQQRLELIEKKLNVSL